MTSNSGSHRLPPGAVLLHIGPPKTATTALQRALHAQRDELRALNVIYPGDRPQHAGPALALTGRRGPRGFRRPALADWEGLVAETKAAPADARVVISSEFFADCNDEQVDTVVAGLGSDRLHILITARPLAKLLPSAWQQYARNGLAMPYEKWLDAMLRKAPYERPTPSFWVRHRHEVLASRWAKLLPSPDRITVVVLDERERDLLGHAVEDLLDLPREMLKPPENLRSNRSLTLAEIELVRRLNAIFKRRGWSDEVYRKYVLPMTQELQEKHQPTPDEPRIVTPAWALDRAAEIGEQAASSLLEMGARIVGDPRLLGRSPTPVSDQAPQPMAGANPALPVDQAARAIAHVIAAALDEGDSSRWRTRAKDVRESLDRARRRA